MLLYVLVNLTTAESRLCNRLLVLRGFYMFGSVVLRIPRVRYPSIRYQTENSTYLSGVRCPYLSAYSAVVADINTCRARDDTYR